jgi:hypothetical protein
LLQGLQRKVVSQQRPRHPSAQLGRAASADPFVIDDALVRA